MNKLINNQHYVIYSSGQPQWLVKWDRQDARYSEEKILITQGNQTVH